MTNEFANPVPPQHMGGNQVISIKHLTWSTFLYADDLISPGTISTKN